jgi:hypothetical protein
MTFYFKWLNLVFAPAAILKTPVEGMYEFPFILEV